MWRHALCSLCSLALAACAAQPKPVAVDAAHQTSDGVLITRDDYVALKGAIAAHPKFEDPIFRRMIDTHRSRVLDASVPWETRGPDLAAAEDTYTAAARTYPNWNREGLAVFAWGLRLLELEAQLVEHQVRTSHDPAVAKNVKRASTETAAALDVLIGLVQQKDASIELPAEDANPFLELVAPAFPHLLDEASPDRRRALLHLTAEIAEAAPRWKKLLVAMAPPSDVELAPTGPTIAGRKTTWKSKDELGRLGLQEPTVSVADGLAYTQVVDAVQRMCAGGASRILLQSGDHVFRLPVECREDRAAVRMAVSLNGIALSTEKGNVAPGCKAEGPGMAVGPGAGSLYDAAAFAPCLMAVRAAHAERVLKLSAQAALPFGEVIFLGAVSTSMYGALFTDVVLEPPPHDKTWVAAL